MTSRFTQTEKWDDIWFRPLSPNAKTLYWYIWDKCNIAGFWEVDLDGAVFHTKISKRSIEGAYKELSRGFETNGNYIWVRRFLYHQKNLPLNPDNPAHKGILRVIEEYKTLFPNVLQLLDKQLTREETKGATKGLVSPISISKGISKGKGKYTEDFETFWEKYPTRWVPESDKHVKIGKDLAWQQWRKIGEDAHRYILGIISQMKSGKAVPDPWRWLRDKKWKDYEPPKPIDSKIEAKQAEKERQKKREELGRYYRKKTTEELKEDFESYGCFLDRWLIKEVLAERKDK